MKKIGFFDENIFLYYEDDDLCIKSRENGFENILVSKVIVDHFAGGSIGYSNDIKSMGKIFPYEFFKMLYSKEIFWKPKPIKISFI